MSYIARSRGSCAAWVNECLLRPLPSWFYRRAIKEDWEAHPFIGKYYLSRCPKVGYLFTWKHTDTGWAACDFEQYENDREVTDEEFKELFNNRDLGKCAGN